MLSRKDTGADAWRKPHPTWLTTAAAIGLTFGLAIGPLVPPVAAQQTTATPTAQTTAATPTSQAVPVQFAPAAMPTPQTQTVTQTFTQQGTLTTAIPTPSSIGSSLATPVPPTLKSCGGGDPSRLFVNCAIGPIVQAEDALQAWAINSTLQLYQLPPTDGPRLMSSARDTLSASILSRLLTAAGKPASQQTPEEQTALAELVGRVKAFKIQAARAANVEYGNWQANAFCYQPPQAALAAGTWSCNPSPTPQAQLFTPEPPTFEQFESWGNAIALGGIGQPSDAAMAAMGLHMKILAGMLGSTPPATATALAAGWNMPQSWFNISAPFRYRRYLDAAKSEATSSGSTAAQNAEEAAVAEGEQAASEASSAATAEAGSGVAITDSAAAGADTAVVAATAADAPSIAVAGVAGATVVGASVGIVLICVTSLVEVSLDLATRLQLPDKLNGAITSAQNSTTDLAGADNALAQTIFASMLAKDPTPDPGPAPSPSDLQINPDDPSSPQSIHYLAPDGSFHTARAPRDGWWVVTDATGTSRLTLSIDFLDPYHASWSATRVGPSVQVARMVDASPAAQVSATTFQYLDWNPADHTSLVTRRAHFVSGSTETWGAGLPRETSMGPASAGPDGNAIKHFDPATGQWSTVDGAAIAVAVGPGGQPWVINDAGKIFTRSRGKTGYADGAWQSVGGGGIAVSVGADGSVWGIGLQAVGDTGNFIMHYHPDASGGWWQKVDGGGVAIAVAPTGQPWVVNKQGDVFQRVMGLTGYEDGGWQQLPGKATSIAIGGDGGVWVVGLQSADAGGNLIYHYNPSAPTSWDQVDGAAVSVTVDSNGQPSVVNKQGMVWGRSRGKTSYVDGTWTQVSPAGSVGASGYISGVLVSGGIGAGGPLF